MNESKEGMKQDMFEQGFMTVVGKLAGWEEQLAVCTMLHRRQKD